MADDILCPTCGHSLAFHKYDYGTCEAPLGGLTSKSMCGCPFTIHTYIQNMQQKYDVKEIEQLGIKYINCMDELINTYASLTLAKEKFNLLFQSSSKRIEFLESKLKTVRELLDKIRPTEKAHHISEWIGILYRNEVIKIVNEIILELEKDMDNG